MLKDMIKFAWLTLIITHCFAELFFRNKSGTRKTSEYTVDSFGILDNLLQNCCL